MAHDGAPAGEYVAILDAGSQYGKVIDRKVRELRVETVILPLDTPVERLRNDENLKGVIISGGPCSVNDASALRYDKALFTMGKPVFGICYGMQMLAETFGGEVQRGKVREDGQDEIEMDTSSPIFAGLKPKEAVLLTHGDSITSAGPAMKVIARSSANIIAGVQHSSLPLFGVQFHPEVELTVSGKTMFYNFLHFCGCAFTFTMEDREAVALRLIRERTAGGQKVLCLASGGVDSTVCAVLLLKALGPERVECIHIDHGFMRLHESTQVVEALQAAGVHLHLVKAQDDFAQATTEMAAKGSRPSYTTKKLCETTDPEEKRNIIGNTFMKVCDRVIKELQLDVNNLLLAQGTLRPDLIESGSKYASANADAIKTHHNDTAVVRQLRDAGRIIEPLCDYHKDEVRELGVRLGIPRHLVERQPFPGPGLAIRTLCSDGTPFRDAAFAETEATVKRVCSGEGDAAVTTLARTAGLSACVLPVRTVGVQGDGRTYAYAAALSMQAFPRAEQWQTLMHLAKVIPKTAHAVNRVVFMFGAAEPNSPIEVTPTCLTTDVLDKLRLADGAVNAILMEHELVRVLSQVPIILVPVGFHVKGGYSVVVRTFLTSDFMTGVPATPGSAYMPLKVLEEIAAAVQQLDFVGRVMYDLTAKPPGTTEWE
ncbi:putative GMP synthase putativeglutamine amidotransferase [Leptomonas pyrrhocoris]|uniref:GMP synthase (glutamine-hydrolyzing) n=1 Tax=Leptomonas pyrrhocoris TaxID=157538 RepID=A0A0N0DZR2_LEPPY|nr:putative GMP synthase putativeglutamine amidotransferase [Leptomonas pyrrhocoris]KPA85592.1 putative GMP synthase putativeglutamine amidotransferase [Leptomonas pyrrhocoris]|eukprot:XP_015664031.1 putative GMP synthase putativeglutamine amidotransferase [Leptomonas pyrrhocoris]